MKCYLTADGLEAVKANGLEIAGASFTVDKVSVCNDGFQMPNGAIWGGYFWVDGWNTLELFKTAFEKYADLPFMSISISADNGSNIDYQMKVLTQWEPEIVWFANDKIKHTPSMAICDFADNSLGEGSLNVAEALKDHNTVMFQAYPGDGNPAFNLTAIVLANNPDGTFTGVKDVVINESETVDVYSISGILVKKEVNAANATEGLSKGLYIIGSKKVLVK